MLNKWNTIFYSIISFIVASVLLMSDLFEMVVNLKSHSLKTVSLTTILQSLLNLKTERPRTTVQIFTKECFSCFTSSNQLLGNGHTFSKHFRNECHPNRPQMFLLFWFTFSRRNWNYSALIQECLIKDWLFHSQNKLLDRKAPKKYSTFTTRCDFWT